MNKEKVLGFYEKDSDKFEERLNFPAEITIDENKLVPVNLKSESITIERLKEMVEEQRNKNPYPIEVFVGSTEEGKIGKFACKVYNDCVNDFLKAICEEKEEKELEK